VSWTREAQAVGDAFATPPRDTCTCYPKASTDGCTEWSCLYHGEENARKQKAQRARCAVHGAAMCEFCGTEPAEPGHPHCEYINCAIESTCCGPDARDDARDQAALDRQRDMR